MKPYLKDNSEYWQQGYEAENVESFVFRPFGQILKPELGLEGSRGEKLLDFGCGSGATLNFFKSKGFDVYGVDISSIDVERAKTRMSDIADHLLLIEPTPKPDMRYFPFLGEECFDIVTAIQSLYYLDNEDFGKALQSLYTQLKPGGIIYATMMGTKCWYFDHSVEEYDGLRGVSMETARLKIKNYHINFTASESELIGKFNLFKKVHVGWYDAQFREDEGSIFHWTFLGRKE